MLKITWTQTKWITTYYILAYVWRRWQKTHRVRNLWQSTCVGWLHCFIMNILRKNEGEGALYFKSIVGADFNQERGYRYPGYTYRPSLPHFLYVIGIRTLRNITCTLHMFFQAMDSSSYPRFWPPPVLQHAVTCMEGLQVRVSPRIRRVSASLNSVHIFKWSDLRPTQHFGRWHLRGSVIHASGM